jgi:hypothetical protein
MCTSTFRLTEFGQTDADVTDGTKCPLYVNNTSPLPKASLKWIRDIATLEDNVPCRKITFSQPEVVRKKEASD